MGLDSLIYYISLSILIVQTLFLTEFLFSLYKKDGHYAPTHSFYNIINGYYFVRAMGSIFSPLVFLSLVQIYTLFLGKTSNNTYSLFHFIITVLCTDFLYFAFHYAHHRISWLWPFHSVHHSDHKYNLTTDYRASVIQKMYGAIVFIPLILLGFNPELIVISSILIVTYQTFTHSAYIRLPSVLSFVLILPQTHKIHHDQNEKHQNSNYGSMFSIWDRIFGTLVEDIDWKEYKAGINGYIENNSIKYQLDQFNRFKVN